MRTLLLASLLCLASACSPDPKDCVEKGDDNACRKLCETGKPEFESLCYMPRTRKILACVDKDVDCANACKEWSWPDDEDRRKLFVTNVALSHGDEAKVAAIDVKCGQFKAAPAAPAAP